MKDEKIEQILSDMALFQGVGSTVLQLVVENSELLRLSSGEVVFEEGDESARNLYVLLDGTAGVVKTMRDEGRDVAVLKGGDYFGELALFSDKPRSATVEVREGSVLLEIPFAVIESIKKENPRAVVQLYENMFSQVARQFRSMARKAEKSQFWL